MPAAQQQDFREIVSTYDGDILDKAFACRLATNFNLLINCAGPFTEESAVLLEEAVKNGTHYIDISGEIGFVKSSYEKYDAIAIIYFHIEKSNRDIFVRNVINSLKNDGKIILLVYEEEHINNGSGGPSDIELLYSLSEVVEDFISLEFNTFKKEFISRTKKERKQKSTVIKFVGTKF